MLWPARELAKADIRDSLCDLNAEFVLAQRQVIVVVTITIVSVSTSSFHWIYVPALGRMSNWAPYVFGLLFTTFTVLWFCQVFPKRIAARYPERFWRFSRWLLKPILFAGRIFDLPAPSDDLVSWWDWLFCRSKSVLLAAPISPHVASLWANCDCPVCSPRALAEASEIHDCDCSICESRMLNQRVGAETHSLRHAKPVLAAKSLYSFIGGKRRNVYEVGVAYAVFAWLMVQIATQTFPFFDIPNWTIRLVILLVMMGFPIALVTSAGSERTGVRRGSVPGGQRES